MRMIIFSTLVLLISCGALSFLLTTRFESQLTEVLGRKGTAVAWDLVSESEREGFESLKEAYASSGRDIEDSEAYKQISEEFKTAINTGLADGIFGLVRSGEDWVYLIDIDSDSGTVEATGRDLERAVNVVKEMAETGEPAHSGFVKRDDDSYSIISFFPLYDGSKLTGALGIEMDATEEYQELIRSRLMTLLFTIIAIIAAGVAIFFISGYMLRPLKKLLVKMNQIGEGDFTVTFEEKGKGEVADIVRAMESVVSKVRLIISDLTNTIRQTTMEANAISRSTTEMDETFENTKDIIEDGTQAVSEVDASIDSESSAIEEISTSSQNLASMAQDLNDLTNTISGKAETGKETILSVNNSISDLSTSMDTISEEAKNMVKKASTISEVLETIGSIAEQTNLLALNAAIEAARAGEAGKGFAVVADEIRKLAEESRAATDNISKNLNEVMEGIEKTADDVVTINGKISEVTKANDETAGNVSEILNEIQSINDMTSDLAANAQEQGAATEEIESSSEELKGKSEDLKKILSEIDHNGEDTRREIKTISDKMEGLTKSSIEASDELSQFSVYEKEDYETQLEKALDSHEKWFERLKAKIDGDTEARVETDPSRCNFGIFYNSIAGYKGHEEDEWKRIGENHRALHNASGKLFEVMEHNPDHVNEEFKKVKAIYNKTHKSIADFLAIIKNEKG